MMVVSKLTTDRNIDKITKRQIPRGTHLADKPHDKIVNLTRF